MPQPRAGLPPCIFGRAWPIVAAEPLDNKCACGQEAFVLHDGPRFYAPDAIGFSLVARIAAPSQREFLEERKM
jgi:hypothetical protein